MGRIVYPLEEESFQILLKGIWWPGYKMLFSALSRNCIFFKKKNNMDISEQMQFIVIKLQQ